MSARRGHRHCALLVLGLLPLAAHGGDAPADAAQDYVLHCQGCHGGDGEGVAHRVPALRDSLPRLVAIDAGRDFVMRVPGAASSRLSDARLAAVLNWLVLRYAGAEALKREFSADEVGAARRRPLAAVHRARQEVVAALATAGLPQPVDY